MGKCVFLGQLSSANLPQELRLASALKLENTYLHKHVFDAGQKEGEAAMQLKKNYGRKGYCGVAQEGPGIAGKRKQEVEKNIGPDYVALKRLCKSV